MNKLAVWCCVFFLAVPAVQASYISLNTTVLARTSDQVLKIIISAVNRGDEPAYNVQAEIKAGGQTIFAAKETELGVGQTYEINQVLALNLPTAGSYPLIVVMHYADANQYPFSALTAQTITYQAGNNPAQIFGRLPSSTFWQAGQLPLTLKNLSDQELVIKTSLVVPRELSVTGGSRQIRLAPHGAGRLDFSVTNFSALAGSTYQVFAVSEYELAGRQQTVITPGTVKIVEQQRIFGLDFRLLFGLLVVLLLFFGLRQIFKK